jgi:hypothetical protein
VSWMLYQPSPCLYFSFTDHPKMFLLNLTRVCIQLPLLDSYYVSALLTIRIIHYVTVNPVTDQRITGRGERSREEIPSLSSL